MGRTWVIIYRIEPTTDQPGTFTLPTWVSYAYLSSCFGLMAALRKMLRLLAIARGGMEGHGYLEADWMVYHWRCHSRRRHHLER